MSKRGGQAEDCNWPKMKTYKLLSLFVPLTVSFTFLNKIVVVGTGKHVSPVALCNLLVLYTPSWDESCKEKVCKTLEHSL